MATVEEIKRRARDIVLGQSGGIRYSQIVSRILAELPEANRNTILTSVGQLEAAFPTEIIKPSRGLYQSRAGVNVMVAPPPIVRNEVDYYEPFATWLKNDLEEVTEVAALGGAALRAKWGTPDVVGVYKPSPGNLIRFGPEIVTAEIKVDPTQPVVAFGQAIAYRLFSTKTYVVMPSTMTEEDESRLESLCMLFGIGMVLFEPGGPNTEFEIRVRAQRFTPDMYYVNEFADRLRDAHPEAFLQLFR